MLRPLVLPPSIQGDGKPIRATITRAAEDVNDWSESEVRFRLRQRFKTVLLLELDRSQMTVEVALPDRVVVSFEIPSSATNNLNVSRQGVYLDFELETIPPGGQPRTRQGEYLLYPQIG